MPNRVFGTANDRDGGFFLDEDPVIDDDFGQLLLKYSYVSPTEAPKHVRAIRDKAWQVAEYPCIGNYVFCDFSITEHPIYPEVLQRLKEGEDVTLLDMGCCFGQDLRKLAFDGVDSANLSGFDRQPKLIDLGYDLFNDRDRFQAKFFVRDVFSDQKIPGLEDGSFDFIHAASFFHLFNWEECVSSMTRALKLLKIRPGSTLFGRQRGLAVAGVERSVVSRSGLTYRQNETSFRRLVDEVERKIGRKFRLEAECYRHPGWTNQQEPDLRLVRFAVIAE